MNVLVTGAGGFIGGQLVASLRQRGRGRIGWPPCVRRYHYTPVYPHGGAGLKDMVTFDPAIRPVWDDNRP